MPRDASGTYTKPAGTTAVTGQIISSSAYNNLANDEATALTDSLSRSGKGGMQAALAMGAQKITNLGNSTDSSDAVRRDQALTFARTGGYGGVSTGSANAQAVTLSPTLAALADGLVITFRAGFTNSAATTLDVNGLGTRTVRREDGTTLLAGDIVAGGICAVLTNATSSLFILLNPRNITTGNAGSRDVGTSSGNLPEVVDGSGNLNAAINVANKTLANLTGAGLQRTVWASICFSGAGALVGAFNSATVVRNSAGLYTITFPSIGNTVFHADTSIDVTPDASGTNHNVVSGSRTTTSVQIACRKGNTSVDPFDPDIITVAIFKIV